MVQAGLPVVDLTQMFLMSGVGAGKWTLDFALLLAGPVAHMMVIMAKSYGLKYELGIEDKSSRPPSMALFEAVSEINRAKARAAGRKAYEQIDDIEAETSKVFKDGTVEPITPRPKFNGFMSAQNPDEQKKMLGEV